MQFKINKWQTKTFPESTSQSKLIHLRHEIDEVEEALMSGSQEEIAMELADCAILLMGIAGLNGINLLRSCARKFKILKKRKWKAPVDGVYFHEKDNLKES